MRRIISGLLLCLLLAACTVGVVSREVLTPGASVLPTPVFTLPPVDTPQRTITLVPPTITPWPQPTPIPFPPLITAGVTSAATIADAQNVELVSHVDLECALDVAVSGNYAYVADSYTGLQVIDISFITSLGGVGFPEATWSEKTFVRSPGLSKPHIGRGVVAQSVIVVGDYAYVTGGLEGLRVVNVSNPAVPQEIGFYRTPGQIFEAYDAAVAGNYAYVADGGAGLRVIDISDVAVPVEVGFYDTPGSAQGVTVEGGYAYVADGEGLRVVDVSAPTTPVEVSFYDTPALAWDVTIVDGYAYISWNFRATQRAGCSSCQRGMSIVAISGSGTLADVGTYYTTGEVSDVVVEGDYAYVAAGEKGLRVVDISDPTAPVEIGFYGAPGDSQAVAVANGYIYVANGDGGMFILRFVPPAGVSRQPAIPSLRGEWRRVTTADGLCTDWPILIGEWYIGTGSTTICGSPPVGDTTWPTMTVPLGTRVVAGVKFRPDGTLTVATDAGVCMETSWLHQERPDDYVWECETREAGFPYEDIRGMTYVNTVPVYMLADTIAYRELTYSIPEIVGSEDARPTWIAVSGNYISKIWVGTNGYGIVVIQPGTDTITRYTMDNGLPGNVIRDINIDGEPDDYYQDVWAATNNGVGHWDGEQWTAYTTTDGLPSNDVRGVASRGGQADDVWGATAGGAAHFDGHSWQAFTQANGLPEGDLNGVTVWGNEVWFSTRGSGLLIFTVSKSSQ